MLALPVSMAVVSVLTALHRAVSCAVFTRNAAGSDDYPSRAALLLPQVTSCCSSRAIPRADKCPGTACSLYTVLCCAVLCCTVLCCAVLYCTVVYCTVLCCTVLYCTVL